MEEPEGKGEDAGEVTDDTLKRLEQGYLRDLKLQGVENVRKVRGKCYGQGGQGGGE